MQRTFLLLQALGVGANAAASTKPPIGWSSWYAFGGEVNQTMMERTYAKLTNKSVVPGFGKSLADVGYRFANLDDGWQACGQGPNGGFHDASGRPMMNTTRFPNVTAMTALAHSLGLSPGFYVNNYICGGGDCKGGAGSPTYHRNMNGTVGWLKENRFEYLKVDSGGCYNDMQLWHDLLEDVNYPMMTENCHQGGSPPNASWCPFDLWRVGGDVNGMGPDNEINLVIVALNKTFPRASCRPYPDFMSFSSDVNETRSLFGIYAIMGTPMIMSFDITDDTKLLPIWNTLTNEQVLGVNQDSTAAVGTLVSKFSAHPVDAPVYAWSGPCDPTDPAQSSWSYDSASKAVTWRPKGSETGLCLTASSGLGASLELLGCKADPDSTQSWLLQDGRLWQAVAPPPPGAGQRGSDASADGTRARGVGSIALAKCDTARYRPGQQWRFTVGTDSTTNVQVSLGKRMGGCWEITGCAFGDDASIGTTYGCKGIPRGSDKSPCDWNGAWTFNPGNQTITSAMSGKCTTTANGGAAVVASTCTGKPNQQWKFGNGAGDAGSMVNGQIESIASPGMCVDNGDLPAPPGTTGNCAALIHGEGGDGPGVSLQSPNTGVCFPSQTAKPSESFSIVDGMLKVGEDAECVAGRHGAPSPYGPLQLWAKALAGGAVAVLLANRGGGQGPAVSVAVRLSELPGLSVPGRVGGYVVRDLWQHTVVDGAIVDGAVQLSAAPRNSVFYTIEPKKVP